MPLTLADLKAKVRRVAVPYEGDTVQIEYRPQLVNPTYQTRLKQLAREGGEDEAVLWEEILRVLVSWDITDDGQPLPVNLETVALLPSDLLMAIVQAVQADASPNRRSGGTSAAG